MFKETKQRTKLDFIIKNTSFENDSFEKIRDINEYLFVNPKNAGKINTPLSLVREMISKLPEDAFRVGKKTLDPCCKNGIFLKVIHMVRQQLGQTEEEIQNDLYGFEPDPVLVSLAKHITGLKNIYIKDFIKEKIDMEFDVIVGNPPYQAPQNAKGKRGGGALLWPLFVERGLKSLKKGGYLVFVHPALWRKPEHDLWKEITSRQIHYLEIHGISDGYKTFGVGTRYDWYILENVDKYEKTIVIDEKYKQYMIDLGDWLFLPNQDLEIFEKMLDSSTNEGNILFNFSNYESRKEWVADNKTNEYKYPLIHSIGDGGKVIRYMYSNRNDMGHFGISKVIISDNGNCNPFTGIIDMSGKYGMTNHSMAIPVENENDAKELKTFLESKIFYKILKATLWSNYQIDYRMFKYFKKDFWKEFI